MLYFIEKLFFSLLVSIIPSLAWTLLSNVIILGLLKLKNKDTNSSNNEFTNTFTYYWFANYILMTLYVLCFINGNINLF